MWCFTEEIGTAWFSQITMSSPTPSTATSPGTKRNALEPPGVGRREEQQHVTHFLHGRAL
jgi:hypothetical protein